MKIGNYEYPYDVMETTKINRVIRDDFNKVCKKYGIIKSKLIEEFYKLILIRFHDGSLDATKGNLTMNILRGTVRKSK